MAKDELRRHHLVTGQAMRTQRGPFGSRTHDVVIARGRPSIRRLAWREATGAAPEVSNHVGILVHIALPRPLTPTSTMARTFAPPEEER